ncbi:Protein CYPRO4 [Camellia lanceoleosa]|uniref:Protein CYPRO4 n=1 Tax=Camellia lanceoleosa TaxID=1840588 RepID=A0ACC0ICW1_9ERIC|nr:Protein CYPRO4 [Camellia lanceoleosa]
MWVLKVGSKVKANIGTDLQLKSFEDQRKVDFVSQGVWAMKFFSEEDYKGFVTKFQDCLSENTYGFESNDANKVKVYRKDFIRWAKPESADDSV